MRRRRRLHVRVVRLSAWSRSNFPYSWCGDSGSGALWRCHQGVHWSTECKQTRFGKASQGGHGSSAVDSRQCYVGGSEGDSSYPAGCYIYEQMVRTFPMPGYHDLTSVARPKFTMISLRVFSRVSYQSLPRALCLSSACTGALFGPASHVSNVPLAMLTSSPMSC
jgi:hypothetical protein